MANSNLDDEVIDLSLNKLENYLSQNRFELADEETCSILLNYYNRMNETKKDWLIEEIQELPA